MTDTLIDRRDLSFQLYEVLGVDVLAERERFADHSRDTFDAVIETADKMARDTFANHNRAADQDEPRFVNGNVALLPQVKQAFDAYARAGFIAGRYDYELGGMQLPETVMAACNGFFTAANPSTAGYPFLTTAAANLIRVFGSESQKSLFFRLCEALHNRNYLHPIIMQGSSEHKRYFQGRSASGGLHNFRDFPGTGGVRPSGGSACAGSQVG
ncbi:acyl-CoA dehydrogenase family protein [Marinobacter sp. ELB17]|nr:acyl-CoA dehydrogenase family protein [Marinobacter sp. ELB17]